MLINEAKIEDLIDKRDDNITSSFIKKYLKNDDMIYVFKTQGTGVYNQYIKFLDAKNNKNIHDCDIEVYCTCPDYSFGGYKYQGTLEGYNFSEYSENRKPKREPKFKVCKHLNHILKNFYKLEE